MNVWVRYDALDRKSGAHVQGSGALVDIEPDERTEDGWATFYILGDNGDNIMLCGRVTDHHLLGRLAGEP